jgi:hypothetical protein
MRERELGCAAVDGRRAAVADRQVMIVREYGRIRASLQGVCYTAAG